MVAKRKFNSVRYADEGLADKKSLIKIYKKQVDNFLNSEYNKSTKREVSSWWQDTKHKVFASVALAT